MPDPFRIEVGPFLEQRLADVCQEAVNFPVQGVNIMTPVVGNEHIRQPRLATVRVVARRIDVAGTKTAGERVDVARRNSRHGQVTQHEKEIARRTAPQATVDGRLGTRRPANLGTGPMRSRGRLNVDTALQTRLDCQVVTTAGGDRPGDSALHRVRADCGECGVFSCEEIAIADGSVRPLHGLNQLMLSKPLSRELTQPPRRRKRPRRERQQFVVTGQFGCRGWTVAIEAIEVLGQSACLCVQRLRRFVVFEAGRFEEGAHRGSLESGGHVIGTELAECGRQLRGVSGKSTER